MLWCRFSELDTTLYQTPRTGKIIKIHFLILKSSDNSDDDPAARPVTPARGNNAAPPRSPRNKSPRRSPHKRARKRKFACWISAYYLITSGDGDEHDSKDGDSDSNDDDVKKVFESASDGDGDNHGSSENGDNSEHGSDGDGDSDSDDAEDYVSVPDAAKWKPLNVPRLHVRQKNRAVRAMMAGGIRFRDSKPGFYNMAIRAAACFKVGVTRTP